MGRLDRAGSYFSRTIGALKTGVGGACDACSPETPRVLSCERRSPYHGKGTPSTWRGRCLGTAGFLRHGQSLLGETHINTNSALSLRKAGTPRLKCPRLLQGHRSAAPSGVHSADGSGAPWSWAPLLRGMFPATPTPPPPARPSLGERTMPGTPWPVAVS